MAHMVREATNPASIASGNAVRHEVVIVGGGNAGLSVAARLRRARRDADIAIVEPSGKHYYQPLWTLVGGGVFDKKVTEHDEAPVHPQGDNVDPRRRGADVPGREHGGHKRWHAGELRVSRRGAGHPDRLGRR